MSEIEIAFDHSYLYVNQQKIFPIIQEKILDFDALEAVNGVLISIDCLQEEIDWFYFHEVASQAIFLGKSLMWELDFHIQDKPVFLEDSSRFFSFLIEEFSTHILQEFKEKTLGVFLFRGTVDFAKYFLWTERCEQHLVEKMQEYPSLCKNEEGKNILRKLFAADVFSDYLHRLASFLPEDALPFCLLDAVEEKSCAVLTALLSKNRFQHILLGVRGARVPLGHLNLQEGHCLGGWIGEGAPYFSTIFEVKTAICLPMEESLSLDVLTLLEETFEELARLNIPFRIVNENLLHECWDGIDDLIVLKNYIGVEGVRKLKGFLAAGGRLISIGSSFDFENEVLFSEWTKTAEVLL